jgi:arginyl-tRNA synthetase
MKEWIGEQMRATIVAEFGEAFRDVDPLVTPATKAAFGDYQCNAAMSLGKRVGMPPRDVATRLVAAARLDGVCEQIEIAGPGFLNLRVREDVLVARLRAALADPTRLALPVKPAQRIIVDYSSPNIAKEMHVGHLRSTVIGDALARVLELQGHEVLRLNHVGDWGTQFGMLITYLREVAPAALETVGADGGAATGGGSGPAGGERANLAGLELGDLVVFYKAAKKRFDEDPAFQAASRQAVVALQAGDPPSLAAWRALCAKSREQFDLIYSILGVDPRLLERGESFYNPILAQTVTALEQSGLLVESEGARVIHPASYDPAAAAAAASAAAAAGAAAGDADAEGGAAATSEGPPPLIVVKSDGGYMYSTTDLAAITHRASVERAQRILYVTDAGQSLHFAQVFDAARRAALLPAATRLEHVSFGLVLGEDGKKFKTRSGETVRLADLLSEAVVIARAELAERQAQRAAPAAAAAADEAALDLDALARSIGIAAVKYADLSMNRNSNYRFSYAKMLALSGNTAPYMLYAYARIAGIQRKARAAAGATPSTGGAAAGAGAADVAISLATVEEKALAIHLARLAEVVDQVRAARAARWVARAPRPLSRRPSCVATRCARA